MEVRTFIYSLSDQEGTPFYVGKTSKLLDVRLSQHLSEARRFMNGKLRNHRSKNEKKLLKIIALDFKVEYKILEVVTDTMVNGEYPKNALVAEYIWITKLITDGHAIVNIKGQKADSQEVELELITLKRAALEIRQKIKQLQRGRFANTKKALA